MELAAATESNLSECLGLHTSGHVGPYDDSVRLSRKQPLMYKQYLIRNKDDYVGCFLITPLKGRLPLWLMKLQLKAKKTDFSKPSVFIVRFMIDERYQSTGYGSEALGLLERMHEGIGFKTMHLSTSPDNEGGIRFYQRNGYSSTGDFNAWDGAALPQA